MEPPPLTLEITRLTPSTLVPTAGSAAAATGARGHLHLPAQPAHPSPFQLTPAVPVPRTAAALPAPVVPLHTSSNYAPPYGTASLGETLTVGVRLRNTSGAPVRGVKMMVEVQCASGRFRLGEMIHGAAAREDGTDPSQAESRTWDAIPQLMSDEVLELAGSHDIAELKDHILICSVAWETPDGRRTFQRFVKFMVSAPFDIKTRVHTSSLVNLALSPRRADTYLEVLVQNVSSAAMVFERVVLEPVPGMQSRNIGRSEAAAAGVLPEDECAEVDGSDSAPSMLPGDTTQRLFLLSPTDEGAEVPALEGPQGHLLKDLPLSSFPPHYAPGTALPLGWLDISWVSGPYREHGRFRTLPLRRRAPAVPLINTSRPGTPTARPMSVSMTTQAGSTRHSMLPRWEFDLVLDTERSVPIEEEFTATLKLAVRSAPVLSDDAAPPPPPPLQLGVQVLYRPPPPPLTAPAVTIRAPSRTVTPSAGAARPQSPTASLRSLSRPMTPVSQQLRHAAVTSLASPTSTPSLTPPPPLSAAPLTPAAAFPPAPLGVPAGKRGIAPPPPGRVAALGTSLVLPPPGAWCLVRDRAGTAYAAEAPGTTVYRRWEVTYDVPIRFLALAGGLADLGGLRVVVMDEGSVGREWESLGDVWVTDD